VQVRRKHARLGNDPLEEAAARKMFQQRRIHRGHIVLGNILLEHARANRSAPLGQTDRISGIEAAHHRDSREVEQNYLFGKPHTPSPSSYDRCIRTNMAQNRLSTLTKAY